MNLIITLDKNNIKINGGSYLKNSFKIIELKDLSLEKIKSINYDYVYLFLFGKFEINKNLPDCCNNDYGVFCLTEKIFPAFFCLKKSFFEVFFIIIGDSVITKTGENLEFKNIFTCHKGDINYKIEKFNDFISLLFNASDSFVPVVILPKSADMLSNQLFNKFSMLEFCDKSIYDSCFNFIMNSLNNYQKKFLDDNLYNRNGSIYFINKKCSEQIKDYFKKNPYTIPEDYAGKNENFIYGDKSDLE